MNSWSKHHRPGFSSLVVALLAMSAGGVPAAAEILPGPVLAEVVEIIDGDTLAVRARIWLDQTIEARVRLSGIDAPELRGRCAAERHAAVAARALIGLAHDLGMRVIASGVDDDATAVCLRDLDCDFQLGAAHAVPLDAEDVQGATA